MTFSYQSYFLKLFILAVIGVSLFSVISADDDPSTSSGLPDSYSDNDGSLKLLWNLVSNIDFRMATIVVSLILLISVVSTLYIHFSTGDEDHA